MPQTLEALMRAFVECRIKPYYLHHADLAPGTSHFRTAIEEGQALMRALRGRVSGLAQPTYVLDIPGGHGKVPVGPGYVDMCGEAGAVVEDGYQRIEREVRSAAAYSRSLTGTDGLNFPAVGEAARSADWLRAKSLRPRLTYEGAPGGHAASTECAIRVP